jgi:hypothetical protein
MLSVVASKAPVKSLSAHNLDDAVGHLVSTFYSFFWGLPGPQQSNNYKPGLHRKSNSPPRARRTAEAAEDNAEETVMAFDNLRGRRVVFMRPGHRLGSSREP